ncbi:MAG: hypothetical protein ACRCTI_21110 [Beijerinckiaceae bacterium]
MKQAFAIPLICCFAFPAIAQERVVQVIHGAYEARLSGYCRSITDRDVASGPFGDFRVRRGGSLVASGNRHTIYVDDGASVSVTGQASTVFVARGGHATIGGVRNQVFTEPGGRVVIKGQASLATVGELDLRVNRNADECR